MMKIAMILTSKFQYSGITQVVMNYYQELIKDKNIKIDFIIPNEPPNDLKKEIESNGSKIFIIPMRIRRKRTIKYIIELKKILINNGYDIVHVHGSSSIMALELYAAKIAGIKVRIAHSHSCKSDHKIINFILKPIFKMNYTHAFACSEIAGQWLFKNKKFEIITNGFDVSKYIFNNESRNEKRKELNINDETILLGHVGLFNNSKNQKFLIDLMEEVLKHQSNIKLLLIGKGEKLEDIKKYAKKKSVYENIIFFGETQNVSDFYSAMDVFLFPSKFEGLGLAVVEAQLSGLPCIISKYVPLDVKISKNLFQFGISSKNLTDWNNIIYNIISKKSDRQLFFEKNIKYIKKYKIEFCAKHLSQRYYKILKESSTL